MIRALVLVLATLAGSVQAQEGWPNLDLLLGANLAPGASFERSYWLPDSADPNAARQAIGVVYPIIVGAAGNTGIAVGHFQRLSTGWSFMGPISGVFGHDPRDTAFAGRVIELTTTMPGPNDPRCCPTLPVRWRIDLVSKTAQRLN